MECELGCSIDDQDIHLLFDGKILLNPRESAYSAGLREGSIVEMSVSNSASISILLKAMQGMQTMQTAQPVQAEQGVGGVGGVGGVQADQGREIMQRKEDNS